jgi:hypothetical protein
MPDLPISELPGAPSTPDGSVLPIVRPGQQTEKVTYEQLMTEARAAQTDADAAQADADAAQADADAAQADATSALTAIANLGGGANITNARLIEWFRSLEAELENGRPLTYFSGVNNWIPLTLEIRWPDGTLGTLTVTNSSAGLHPDWLEYLACELNYPPAGKKVIRSTFTLDALGNRASQPTYSVAPI